MSGERDKVRGVRWEGRWEKKGGFHKISGGERQTIDETGIAIK